LAGTPNRTGGPRRRAARWAALAAASLALAAPAPAKTVDRVVAKLNDDIITVSDLAENALGTGRGPMAQTPETFGALLDRTLLLQASRKLSVAPDDREIQRQVEDAVAGIQAQFPNEAQFRAALAKEDTTIEQFKLDLHKKYTTDFKAFRAVSARVSMSDAEVEQFERDSGVRGMPAASYHLRRLAAPVEGSGKDAEAAAKARVQDCMDRINRQGLSFAEGVSRYAPDPALKANGGDLGYMPARELAAPVLAAVKDLKPGEVTKPMITGAFASIFYLEAKRGGKTILHEKKFKQARDELLVELRRKAHLQVYDPALRKVVPKEYRQALENPVAGSGPAAAGQPAPSPTPRRGIGTLFGR
jgi:peptidyl-prolyl cis-trans isomerase SurA